MIKKDSCSLPNDQDTLIRILKMTMITVELKTEIMRDIANSYSHSLKYGEILQSILDL